MAESYTVHAPFNQSFTVPNTPTGEATAAAQFKQSAMELDTSLDQRFGSVMTANDLKSMKDTIGRLITKAREIGQQEGRNSALNPNRAER